MTRAKELIAPFAILLGFMCIIAMMSHRYHRAPVEEPVRRFDPNDPRIAVAFRDYAWYVEMIHIRPGQLSGRIELVAYANSLNPGEKEEDHRRGQLIKDRLAEAERLKVIATKITEESGDPLPLLAAKAMVARAKADWLLRQEVLDTLGRQHLGTNPAERIRLEQEAIALAMKVRELWVRDCTGPGIPSSFPVTLP